MHRNHIFKKGNVWLILCLMGGVMIFGSRAIAHEGHWHSLQELALHIDSHLEELESLQANSNVSDEFIHQKLKESILHAEEYKEFASNLQMKDRYSDLASVLEN